MVAVYDDPYECLIFNYFRAKEDLTFLLKKKKKVNAVELRYLAEVYFDLTEFHGKNVAESEYNYNLSKFGRLQELETKISVLTSLSKAMSKLSDELDDKIDLFEFDEILKTYKVQKKETISKQIAEIDRIVRIAENQKTKETPKNVNKKFNWVEQVVVVGKALEMKINSKETTLAEWGELIKMVNNKK